MDPSTNRPQHHPPSLSPHSHHAHYVWPATALDIQNALDEFDSRYLESYHQVTAKMASSQLNSGSLDQQPNTDPASPERSRLSSPLMASRDADDGYLLSSISSAPLSAPLSAMGPPRGPPRDLTSHGSTSQSPIKFGRNNSLPAVKGSFANETTGRAPHNAFGEQKTATTQFPIRPEYHVRSLSGPCAGALAGHFSAPVSTQGSFPSSPTSERRVSKTSSEKSSENTTLKSSAIAGSSENIAHLASALLDLSDRPPRVQRSFSASTIHKAAGRRTRDRRSTVTTCVGNPFYRAAKTSPRRRRDRVDSFSAVFALDFDRSVV